MCAHVTRKSSQFWTAGRGHQLSHHDLRLCSRLFLQLVDGLRDGMGCVTLQVIQPLLGHISLRELMMGCIHRGYLSGGVSLWGAFPSGLSFRIPRSLHSCHYNSSCCLSSVVFTTALRLASSEVFFANGHSSLTLLSLPSLHFFSVALLIAFRGRPFLGLKLAMFPRGTEFFNMLVRGGIASTNTGGADGVQRPRHALPPGPLFIGGKNKEEPPGSFGEQEPISDRESQLFIIPILSHLAPRIMVLGEHDMLKDLIFYEVAHATDSKERQDHLEQMEKKCQDGMLRQAPATNHQASSSIVRPPAKKKGPVIQPIQMAPTPPSASSFLSTLAYLSIFIFFCCQHRA
ncbi:hypothetical protein CK203_056844 [Vitis vinifera]|uniref:Uncharacterized protein n=1 Tax=Vitis vinifera TaxID=29760 RepID=A0A438GQA6_VITVI|nr:hypothetical protein CK203_056844 [Vitis vinifera]